MDGPGFGGMNRIGGGMYKRLFFYVPITIFSKLEAVLRNPRKKVMVYCWHTSKDHWQVLSLVHT